MLAYWVTYAISKHQKSATKQWQIALGLQLLPASLLLFGMLTVKESARWLAKKGKTEQAREALKWTRGGDETEELQQEFDEILAGIAEEVRIKEGFTFKELLLPATRYRLFIAITIQLCAQLTGNTSLAYYANQIFSSVGAGSAASLVTGFFGVVKVVSVLTFQIFVLDRIGGRRIPFMAGAFGMGSCMLIIACLVATHPPNANSTKTSSSGIAAIIFTYAENFCCQMSWGPLPCCTWVKYFLVVLETLALQPVLPHSGCSTLLCPKSPPTQFRISNGELSSCLPSLIMPLWAIHGCF
jgi:hypothetical protein